VTAIDTF
jgi:flagellar biosynthesis component FlhA